MCGGKLWRPIFVIDFNVFVMEILFIFVFICYGINFIKLWLCYEYAWVIYQVLNHIHLIGSTVDWTMT
jgi:hypothetical protein